MHNQERNAHLLQALTWELHVEVKCGTMCVLFVQEPVARIVLTNS